jgi:hypothetical protein
MDLVVQHALPAESAKAIARASLVDDRIFGACGCSSILLTSQLFIAFSKVSWRPVSCVGFQAWTSPDR